MSSTSLLWLRSNPVSVTLLLTRDNGWYRHSAMTGLVVELDREIPSLPDVRTVIIPLPNPDSTELRTGYTQKVEHGRQLAILALAIPSHPARIQIRIVSLLHTALLAPRSTRTARDERKLCPCGSTGSLLHLLNRPVPYKSLRDLPLIRALPAFAAISRHASFSSESRPANSDYDEHDTSDGAAEPTRATSPLRCYDRYPDSTPLRPIARVPHAQIRPRERLGWLRVLRVCRCALSFSLRVCGCVFQSSRVALPSPPAICAEARHAYDKPCTTALLLRGAILRSAARGSSEIGLSIPTRVEHGGLRLRLICSPLLLSPGVIPVHRRDHHLPQSPAAASASTSAGPAAPSSNGAMSRGPPCAAHAATSAHSRPVVRLQLPERLASYRPRPAPASRRGTPVRAHTQGAHVRTTPARRVFLPNTAAACPARGIVQFRRRIDTELLRLLPQALLYFATPFFDWICLPMSSSKKTSQKNKKKICHCDDTCGKRLSARSRRRHYKAARDKANIQPSESESEPVNDDSVSSSPSHTSLSELSSLDDSAMPVDPVPLPLVNIEIELSDISESDSEESTAMDVDEDEEHDFGGYFDPSEPEDAAGFDD
ncbi:hypothetical protein C8R44DRAFT_866502 [Mycena epipterygia]|nr:hypothetical protein C8R44DRAFT_866502 [Mycena epipterygia]